MKPIQHDDLRQGMRVYVKTLDVFGKVEMIGNDCGFVVHCEAPMSNYVHPVDSATVLYKPDP